RGKRRLLLADLLLPGLDFLLAQADVLLARPEVGLAQRRLVFRLLEGFARRQPLFPELLLPFEVLPGKVEAGLRLFGVDARLFDDDPRLLQRRLRGGHARLAALQLPFERTRIDLEQEL